MGKRIIYDHHGEPTLEIDEETGIVMALKDCTINLGCAPMGIDGIYETSFLVEKMDSKKEVHAMSGGGFHSKKISWFVKLLRRIKWVFFG